mmetsp:Transcript_2753/g.7280  ORF Transcript_2753/g.7280 Transcript_2753/m.7280 type:complete len:225 (+) Transcript_2753:934-1608(+)
MLPPEADAKDGGAWVQCQSAAQKVLVRRGGLLVPACLHPVVQGVLHQQDVYPPADERLQAEGRYRAGAVALRAQLQPDPALREGLSQRERQHRRIRVLPLELATGGDGTAHRSDHDLLAALRAVQHGAQRRQLRRAPHADPAPRRADDAPSACGRRGRDGAAEPGSQLRARPACELQRIGPRRLRRRAIGGKRRHVDGGPVSFARCAAVGTASSGHHRKQRQQR